MSQRVVFDLWPIQDRFGVWRYGLSLLRNIVALGVPDDVELIVLANDQQRRLVENCVMPRHNVWLQTATARRGFFRGCKTLRTFVERNADAYFSPDYLGLECSGAFSKAVVVHDLFRVERPEFGYSDDEFRARFGNVDYGRLEAIAGGSALEGGSTFSRALDVLQRRAVSESASVCTPSLYTMRKLRGWLPAAVDKLMLLPPGFEPAWFARAAGEPPFMSLAQENFLLVVRGSGRRHKGWDRIVRSFRQSSLPRAGWKLVSVGCRDGTHEDPAIVELGYVSDADLADLYRQSTALVIGSDDEGFCLPALEARAFGGLVIAPTHSAIEESTDGQASWYPLDDVDGLVSALERLAEATATPRRRPAGEYASHDWQPVVAAWWNAVLREVHSSDREPAACGSSRSVSLTRELNPRTTSLTFAGA